jgi:hypothetical protein
MLIASSGFWGYALCGALVFSSIFGIKIGYLDLSILLPLLTLLLCVSIRQRLRFNRSFLIIAALIIALLAYQTSIQLAYLTFDINSLLRLVRAILICLLISVMVASDLFSSKQILTAIFYSLLAHAILINLAALFQPLNELLGSISGNDRVRTLRASGLLAGFDISGLFCLFGLLMVLLGAFRARTAAMSIIYATIFVLGCFFTSRMSMAFSVLFVLVFGLYNLFKSRISLLGKMLLMLAFVSGSSYLVITYVAPIVDVTFSLGLLDIDEDARDRITTRHATQSEGSFLWSRMFFLPDDTLAKFFGTGVEELNTDVGYIKDIFRYGFTGLAFSMLTYLYMFLVGARNLQKTDGRVHYVMLQLVFFLILLLTLKNNYFFTRAVFPFTLLMIAFAMTLAREANVRTHP